MSWKGRKQCDYPKYIQYALINSCKSRPLVVKSHMGGTLEAGMTEQRNGRMAESQNSGKNDPKSRRGGTAENYPKSKRWNRRSVKNPTKSYKMELR